jgi:hypothetical protein
LEQEEGEVLARLLRSSDPGLVLRLAFVAVAEVRDHVRDVGELLLEVALIGLQPLEQLVAAREAAAEEHPRSATAPAMVTVVHVHLLSS